ncbi:MAG: hypothetical protein M0R05_06065 [Bacilli bacterium]|nr:hypothetical protein [Bacilli bacterium]MDD4076823.1 hypothetical protein [Bacilli bacterium]
MTEANQIATADALTLYCRLNHGNHNYYCGNVIEFTVDIVNNSPQPVYNLIYHQAFPDIVKPDDNTQFSVVTSSGKIIYKEECVIIAIAEIKANDTVRIIIKGRIDDL